MPDEIRSNERTPGAADLVGLYSMLQESLSSSREQAGTLAGLVAGVRELQTEVTGLTRILRGDGNGERGLQFRMGRVEDKVGDISTRVGQLQSSFDTRSTASESGRWNLTQGVVVALITGLFLLGAAIMGAFLKVWKP